jgi:hypothetical protein
MPVLPSLLDLLLAAGAKRAHSVHAVWDLGEPHWPFGTRARRVDEGRQQILQWLLEHVPTLYFVTGESDEMGAVGGALATGIEHTWQLRHGISRAELESAVLHYGGWSLYARPEPMNPADLPDSFDTEPGELVETLKRLNLGLLVEAWHDDVDWRLAFTDESLLRAAA